jgi:hypothetical protein
VFGDCLGLLSRATCPGAVWCSVRRGRFRGVFQVLGGFPQGVVSGRKGKGVRLCRKVWTQSF